MTCPCKVPINEMTGKINGLIVDHLNEHDKNYQKPI